MTDMPKRPFEKEMSAAEFAAKMDRLKGAQEVAREHLKEHEKALDEEGTCYATTEVGIKLGPVLRIKPDGGMYFGGVNVRAKGYSSPKAYDVCVIRPLLAFLRRWYPEAWKAEALAWLKDSGQEES